MFILYVLDAKHRYLSQPIGICGFKGLTSCLLYICRQRYELKLTFPTISTTFSHRECDKMKKLYIKGTDPLIDDNPIQGLASHPAKQALIYA